VIKIERIPWNKGLTKETDIRVALSEKTKQNISKANKGHVAWNKGCIGTWLGRKHSEESKQKIGNASRGRKASNEAKKKMSEAHKGNKSNLGKKLSEETKLKMSKARKNRIGDKAPCWKGGITSLNGQIWNSFEYRQWRSDIFTRDNFTCQKCGQIGKQLNAHHIKSFSSIIQFYEITTLEEALGCEELWNINNGIALCEECHKEIHRNKKLKKKGSDLNAYRFTRTHRN